jgi:prepilin-type N-terminal cleavage/methylation domain-containing protein
LKNGLFVPGAGRRGFTLAEVMTAMAVLVLLTTMALVLYLQGSHHFARTSTDLDAEREARAAMGYAAAEIRQAMPAPGPTAIPVISPTAPSMPNPSPTPTSQIVFTKVDDITQALSGTTLDTANLGYDTVTIQPSPVPSAQPNLVETIVRPDGSTVTRVIGHDVQTFAVTPISANTYDITITTAPFIRTDMLSAADPSLYTYTLSSTVHISYFPTN